MEFGRSYPPLLRLRLPKKRVYEECFHVRMFSCLAREYACKHFYIDIWFVNDSLVIQTMKELE